MPFQTHDLEKLSVILQSEPTHHQSNKGINKLKTENDQHRASLLEQSYRKIKLRRALLLKQCSLENRMMPKSDFSARNLSPVKILAAMCQVEQRVIGRFAFCKGEPLGQPEINGEETLWQSIAQPSSFDNRASELGRTLVVRWVIVIITPMPFALPL